jgi:hypothetical protein
MIFGLTLWDLLGILIFVILLFFLPRIMRNRLVSSVSKISIEMENMVGEAKEILINISKEKGKPSKDPTANIDSFMEFFVVPPVNLDPNGIVKKFDKILELEEERFRDMGQIISPRANEEEMADIIMTLKATIGMSSVNKLVRHNLELAKKTGNLQILLALQMNLPLIIRILKAQLEGVKSFSEGKPIGDGLGPLVASMLMKGIDSENLEEINDMIVLKKNFQDRELSIMRAKGPGARMGKLGKTSSAIIDREGIERIITVDAAAKMEGEKTGQVAEGIGVAIGGLGIDKWFIEEKAIFNNLKIDAIIVKMSPEEAIKQMTSEIAESSKEAIKTLERSIMRSPEGSKILIIGVGNSSGLPNIINDPSQIDTKKEQDV